MRTQFRSGVVLYPASAGTRPHISASGPRVSCIVDITPTICCRVLNEDPTDSGYLASVCLAVSRRLWLSAGKNGMRFVCCLSPASLLCKSPRPLRPPGTCALQSADLERSVAYWADVLGFLEVDRGDEFAVMSAGELPQ